MGTPTPPPPVKLIAGLIFSDPEVLAQARETLAQQYGPVEEESHILPFDFTRYYTLEMGPHLQRQYVSFEQLIACEALPPIKLFTNALEATLADPDGRRRVNLDPGYLSLDLLVLATTKNPGHRPYLGQGIYAELTYRFVQGSFRPLEWTYPDYRLQTSVEFFNRVRQRYREQIKALKALRPPGG
ncbi:MAG: DUF4416 family protein [Candidatus Tectomicrobia bacterium]|uniref:DUF4416 family protein n=1 Tax=Tectimicrobiota bacterium TaxID=2528274 RepID=A0A932CRM6_UNCTE|nr:DUF4416 family protein [Candidatus Tectomicrobia bacterium]